MQNSGRALNLFRLNRFAVRKYKKTALHPCPMRREQLGNLKVNAEICRILLGAYDLLEPLSWVSITRAVPPRIVQGRPPFPL